jgi:hypothetical protein
MSRVSRWGQDVGGDQGTREDQKGDQSLAIALFEIVVCVYLVPAHQVFDEMAARTKYLNFAKLF